MKTIVIVSISLLILIGSIIKLQHIEPLPQRSITIINQIERTQ